MHLGLGHNNDQGMLNLTGLNNWLQTSRYRFLVDGGYTHAALVGPSTLETDEWNQQQKSLRSVVETVFALVKCFRFAAVDCRLAPELQEIALMICYHLTSRRLNEFPLRLEVAS